MASAVVRPRTLVALLALGMLFLAASWVDAGMAASPDPDPSAKESQAPAPDPYQPAAPSAQEPVTQTVTPPVVQVETTPSTGGVTRRAGTAEDRLDVSRTHAEELRPRRPRRRSAPKERRKPVRLAVPAPSDGGPLLLGGLAMVVLALSSGSLLFLVTRAGNAGVGRWETKA